MIILGKGGGCENLDANFTTFYELLGFHGCCCSNDGVCVHTSCEIKEFIEKFREKPATSLLKGKKILPPITLAFTSTKFSQSEVGDRKFLRAVVRHILSYRMYEPPNDLVEE